jgi:nucleoredoxin
MKTALRIVGLLFLAFVAYAYFEMSSDSEKEPADVDKMLNDPEGYVATHAPAALHPELAAQIPDSDDKSEQASPKAVSPSPNPANDVTAKDTASTASLDTNSATPIADSVSNPIKPWTPPAVMPAQSNWTWTTSDGTTYQDVVVTKIEPTTVTITHSLGVAHIPISSLPADIQKKLNYDPAAASQIATLVEDKLVSSDGTAFASPAQPIQYYIFYYSARWCPPCHAYTPELVKWYSQFQPAHPNFELIFVSEDTSEAEMLAYMKEMAVPWPAMRFDQLAHAGDFQGPGVERYAGNVIPFLALVDASGKLLAKSYESGDMVSPTPVMDKIALLTAGALPTGEITKAPSAAPSAITATAPDAQVVKPWSPPNVMPSQPNWTWNMLDGSTYSDVVVTKIEPDTVKITHSLGVAHIPMNLLPQDIQKKLNYDPHASADVPVTSNGK